MGRRNKKRDKRKYQYAVKRPEMSKKEQFKYASAGYGFGLPMRKKDRKKLKKKYGGIPRMRSVEPQFNANRMSRDVYERRKENFYRKLDGGTPDTMFISAEPRAKKRKSRDRDDGKSPQKSSSSYDGYKDFKIDTSAYDKQIKNLNKQIDSLTSGFQQQAAAMQQQMEADKAAAAERMAEMRGNFNQQMATAEGNFRQQMAASVGQPRVEGIRFADYGTGGATRRQLARRGVGGTFGRSGERLMQISSLNV